MRLPKPDVYRTLVSVSTGINTKVSIDTLVQCSARGNADKRKNVDLKFEMSGDVIYQPGLAARF